MADNDLHRDLGRLEGRITALESRVAESDHRNEAAFESLQEGIDRINARLSEAALIDAGRVGNIKGAWWVLAAMLSAAGTIGGAMTWAIKSFTAPH